MRPPALRSSSARGKRLSSHRISPGNRLEQLARTELGELRNQLLLARGGRDRALHRVRKTLQRLRAIVRLLEPIDPALAERENLRLRRMRRSLGPLRDAAARRQTFLLLASRPRWRAHADQLRALARSEAKCREQVWAEYPAGAALWRRLEQECVALEIRLAQWPFQTLDAAVAHQALAKAGKRARRDIRIARGLHGRERRHALRRKLRRLANLQRTAAFALQRSDDAARALLGLAKRCGHEGDLWMAVASVRRVARERPAFRPLLRELEAERRAACARHDRQLHRAGLD